MKTSLHDIETIDWQEQEILLSLLLQFRWLIEWPNSSQLNKTFFHYQSVILISGFRKHALNLAYLLLKTFPFSFFCPFFNHNCQRQYDELGGLTLFNVVCQSQPQSSQLRKTRDCLVFSRWNSVLSFFLLGSNSQCQRQSGKNSLMSPVTFGTNFISKDPPAHILWDWGDKL